jgi:uncharacterized Zn-binding protein involved in type VI secretion
MPPSARLTDMHTCSQSGGPVVGPGVPNVLVGGLPAAVVGDNCTCVTWAGVPIAVPIVMGSTTVMIGNRPAARVGDPTGDGGAISLGCMTVMIGG